MENPENYYNSDFQHGYLVGLENIRKDKNQDDDPYEGYISSHVTYEWLQERIIEKKHEVAKIDTEIMEIKEKQQTLFDILQGVILKISSCSRKANSIQERLDENLQHLGNIQQKRKKNESPYSLFAGILYLLAGVAFVMGDLVISHEIVAYALNIRDNYEAWTFAVGLAMLSILLKPAYDRLIEQPYIHEYSPKTKRTYAIFQGFLVVFSVGTMFVLGWFRYEAYKTDKLKESINRQITAMQNSQTADLPTANSTNNELFIEKIDTQLKAYDKLNLALVNSPWVRLSFVLSGILFAIAGAICLGIALPIVHGYWYAWLQAGPAIRRIKKHNLAFTSALENTESELAEQTVQKNILENNLAVLPNLAELKAEKREILTHIEDMLNRSKVADQDRRINTFDDGLEKGKANREEMTVEEYEVFRNMLMKQIRNSQINTAETNQKIRKDESRPYQALRKEITKDFNQN